MAKFKVGDHIIYKSEIPNVTATGITWSVFYSKYKITKVGRKYYTFLHLKGKGLSGEDKWPIDIVDREEKDFYLDTSYLHKKVMEVINADKDKQR
jgi:hypothetical protein